jgi:hypothetical protein
VPYPQQIIYETDTRLVQIRNAANNAWVAVNTGIPVYSSTAAVTAPFTNQIIYDVSFGGLKQYNGSIWVIYDANTKTIFKASTTARSSTTTLADDPTFVFPVVASSAYSMDGYLVISGSTAADFKMTFTVPTLASAFWSHYGDPGPEDASASEFYSYYKAALPAGTSRSASVPASGQNALPVRGTFVIGANAGNVTLQWAQFASSGTATNLLGGSYLSMKRIA